MKFDAKIEYEEKYLPTKRHRIPRTRTVDEPVTVELREVKAEEAPVAMVVTDYKSYLDESGQSQFGLCDTPFRAIDGRLYREARDMSGALDQGAYSPDAFLVDLNRSGTCSLAWNASKRSREDMLRSMEDFLNSHVMIDGVIYQETKEPRYVVQTFGLGHNHGGTALFVETSYNGNISRGNYFNALQRDAAIAHAVAVATRRGDTDSIDRLGSKNIRVLMPEMVRCNPQPEHGDGDPFMNSIESLIQGSDSVMEAGLLAITATAMQCSEPQSSLADQIRSASTRAAESPAPDRSQKNNNPQFSHSGRAEREK